VAARLNDVWPDGRSTRVTLGVLNLAHRDGHGAARPLVPGARAEAVVEMDDMAYAFEAGHRIAVALSTTYWPVAWPSPELVTLTVACGESWLSLPVRPARPEDAGLRAFDPPEAAATTPYRDLAANQTPRRVVRDLLSGRMSVDFGRWTATTEMPDIGQTHAARGLVRHEIVDGDPLSARTITDYRVEVTRADTVIEHHSRGVLSCDAGTFRVEMDVVIRERGTEVFRRRWDERIARDHL
jgi:uncharacterized protein